MQITRWARRVWAPRLRTGLVAALAWVGLAWPAAAGELVLAISRTSLSLPLYVADSQRYFAAEGVTVRLQDCIGGHRCLRQLFDGKAQLATVSDLPVMFGSFERADYAVIATFVNTANDLKLITRKSAGITSPEHLVGKRVATVKGASPHYFLDTYLLFNGIDPNRVTIVSLPPEGMVAALQRHEVDAITCWEPHCWLAVQALASDAMVVSTPRIYTETFNLAVDRRTLQEREDEVVRVLRALVRAERFIAEQPVQAQEILKQRLQLDQGFVRWAWADLDFRLGLDQSLVTTLEAEARWALREGHLSGERRVPNYLHFVDPGPLRKALPTVRTGVMR